MKTSQSKSPDADGSARADVVKRARRWFLGILAFNVLIIAVAILSGLFHPIPEKATPTRYFGEGKYPTVVSILELAAVGVLCALVWRRRTREGFLRARGSAAPAGAWVPRLIWLAMAAGFVFLALDEWLEIHEKLDLIIHKHVLKAKASDATDRLDDFIVLGYGVAGLVVMWFCRRELWAFRGAWPYVLFTIVTAVCSVAMDALTNREDLISGPLHTWMSVGEDACKLLAEAGFLGAAIHAFLLAGGLLAAAARDRAA